MNAEQFRRVEEVFREALDVAAGNREQFVARACGGDGELRAQVLDLLREDADEGRTLAEPIAGAMREMGVSEEASALMSSPTPDHIGTYRIIRQIGEGGFGVVYLAEQDNPRRTVALKVLRSLIATPEVVKRFEYEVQILGRLQHPGIAQIFEAGVADEGGARQAFYAMEFIAGRNIIAFANDAERVGGPLTVPQRLELFARVCDALQHAHQKGVIHRDLKPDNILVVDKDDGEPRSATTQWSLVSEPSGSMASALRGFGAQPKILDFGVARVVDRDEPLTMARTGVGQLVGTLSYMSPEQLAGNSRQVDTRSDVYTAGVVLYQLLTGHLPFEVRGRPIHEVIRIVREQEHTPVSKRNRALRGDVEALIHKAIEKEPSRRYQSAAELADDIRRYLTGEPILAKRDSALYVLRKRLKQYRAAVTVTAGFVILGLISIASLAWSYRQQSELLEQVRQERDIADSRSREALRAREAEHRARSTAERESARAESVNTFLRAMLAGASPDVSPGPTRSVREMLEKATESLDAGVLSDQPENEAAVRLTLGDVFRDMGMLDQARRNGMRALELERSLSDAPRVEVPRAMSALGLTLHRRGESDAAVSMLRDAIAMERKLADGPDPLLADMLGTLGIALRGTSQFAQAEGHYREALAILQQADAMHTASAAALHNNLADVLLEHGNLDQAEAEFRAALDIIRDVYGPDKPTYASQLCSLAGVFAARRDYPAAVRICEESLRIRRAALPPDHPDVASGLNNLAAMLYESGQYERAGRLFAEALPILRKALGPDHPQVLATLNNLASVRFNAGDLPGAEQCFLECLDAQRRRLGEEHPDLSSLYANLAFVRMQMKDFAQAEKYERMALDLTRRHTPDNFAVVASHLQLLGEAQYEQRRMAEAEATLRACLETWKKAPVVESWRLGTVMVVLGDALREQGRFEEAEKLLLAAEEALTDAPPQATERRFACLDRLAYLYTQWGKPELSKKWADRFRAEAAKYSTSQPTTAADGSSPADAGQ